MTRHNKSTRYEEGDYVKVQHYSSDKIYEVVAVHSPESDSPDYEISSITGESSKPSIIKKASDLKKAEKDEVLNAIKKENRRLEGRFNKGDRVKIIEPSMNAKRGTVTGLEDEPKGMSGGSYHVKTDNHGEQIFAAMDLEKVSTR